MEKYNHKKIEARWQKIWEKTKLYETDLKAKKPKHYNLVMFPYPSGEYLHMGHAYSYSGADVYARYRKLNGFNVFEPIGYDSFGLPAENFAIRAGLHPQKSTESNIKHAGAQLKTWGMMFDWSKTVTTSHPDYYKWTQWLFLKLFKMGLAYQKEASVNWCPKCLTVLANEQVINGLCERCEAEVIQKQMKQWFFKITDLSERLISDLDKVDWPESSIIKQRNWIGKSEGAIIKFKVQNSKFKIEVFTTRLDTIFGCTYMVLAPEHPFVVSLLKVKSQKSKVKNIEEIKKYIIKTQKKTEIERVSLDKQKTGVELKGIFAINPFNNKKIPIWISDYVILSYGTGAVMAVPAHDERDFEFAQKYNLPIEEVIIPKLIDKKHLPIEGKKVVPRKAIQALVVNPKNGKILCLKWKKFKWTTFITGGVNDNEDIIKAAKREVYEETGYKNLKYIRTLGGPVETHFYAEHKDENRVALFTALVFELTDDKQDQISKSEKEKHESVWMSWGEIENDPNFNCSELAIWRDRYKNKEYVFVDYGTLINSGEFSGLSSAEAIKKMVDWLRKRKIGGKKITYRLRDWSIGRQRYWGAPIPLVFCENCAVKNKKQKTKNKRIEGINYTYIGGKEYEIIPVPEGNLPVLLPDINIKDVRPQGTGKGPLANIPEFVNTNCPKCGGKAERETDTMDTFVDSSFYFLRYPSVGNNEIMMEPEVTKKWLPVDMYVGGAEHVTMHLLYARFVTKALFDAKLINFDEPFLALRHQGMILGPDGRKMSKSRGNIVIPDKVIKEYGADTFRTYILFMGPFEDGGPWDPKGIKGVSRFLERYWNLASDIVNNTKIENPQDFIYSSKEIEETALRRTVDKTIKKVGENILSFKFNTAISFLMECVNELYKIQKELKFNESLEWKGALEKLTIIISPFAPHITEEIWSKLGKKESIFLASWPAYNEKLIEEEMITLVIQVDGKLRDKIEVKSDISESEAQKLALDSPKVKKFVKEKPSKIIYVSKKLINVVT